MAAKKKQKIHACEGKGPIPAGRASVSCSTCGKPTGNVVLPKAPKKKAKE